MMDPTETPGQAPVDLSELPEWARNVLLSEKPTGRPTTPLVTDFTSGSTWPALVRAATVSSFVPRELTGPVSTEEARRQIEKNVLLFAEPARGSAGPQWALTLDARRSVLTAASKEEITDALASLSPSPEDPISAALRLQLSSETIKPETAALPDLEATRIAGTWLSGRSDIQTIDLDALSREIALRRLLKPFRRMIGIEDAEGSEVDPSKIRFFGRDAQIKQLRDYVGVLPATSFGGTVARIASQVQRALLGTKPLIVWGIGGVGKTTLIAKFTLEHAEAARSRYPFAYLDFDRTTISARYPALLLAEMCRQVSAQFVELEQRMLSLQDQARRLSASLETSSEKAPQDIKIVDELAQWLKGSRDVETFAPLLPLLNDFRAAVDDHVSNLESRFELRRPFLLIFDTFEIVQYSDGDVQRMADFVRVLTRSANGLGWPRLRLIVSGRSKPAQFLDDFDEIRLGELDRQGSVQMLLTLVKDAGQSISSTDAERLIDATALALGGHEAAGLHPLSIKLLGKIFAAETQAGAGVVAGELVDELLSRSNTDGKLGKALIDGILVRRILDHIADWRVRTLADPGLVVRRITADVIQEVMARGTPRPGSVQEVFLSDNDDFEPWELSPGQAADIFEAFRREHSLIETDEDGLRHRQDLRQEMLPLIRARRPKRFMQLHKLAFEFFRKRPSMPPYLAEAVYHGLWLDVDLGQLDELWNRLSTFDPRIDPEEFGETSNARLYIRAKTRQPLSSAELSNLPRPIAIEWLVSRDNLLLDADNPNDAARTVVAIAGSECEDLDTHVSTAAIVARLFYRTGQWHDSQRLIVRQLEKSADLRRILATQPLRFERVSSAFQDLTTEDNLSLLRTWVTMAAKAGADPLPLEIARTLGAADGISDFLITTELLSYAALGNRMLKERSTWSPSLLNEVGRQAVRAAREVRPTLWRGNIRTLRFAILASPDTDDIADLMQLYLDVLNVPPRDEEAVPILGSALALAYRITDDEATFKNIQKLRESTRPERAANYFQSLWADSQNRILQGLRSSIALQSLLRKIVAFDHADWNRALANALSRAFNAERGNELRDALAKQAFLADLGRRSELLDGIAIVQWASARGNLFRLATTIDDFSEQFSSEADDESTSYPESVFGIAESLLLWHDVNLAAIAEFEEDQFAEEKKPTRRAPKRSVKKKRKKK